MRPALVASLAVLMLTAFLARPAVTLAAESSIHDESAAVQAGQAGLRLYRVHPLDDSLVMTDAEPYLSAPMPDGARLLPMRASGGAPGWILVEEPPYSLAGHIKEARPVRGDYGYPLLEIDLDEQGASLFERITAESIGRKLAIALDGLVYSAPVVQEKISGGKFIISGQFTFDEVRDLASTIRTGATPQIFEETIVPTVPPPAHE